LSDPLAKKRQPRVAKRSATKPPTDPASTTDSDQVQYSGLSLHDLFAQQTRDMLDRSDLDDEQKQSILVAMSCPCCGAGGPSFSIKLKRRS
jgi:hypothetical protein